MRALRPGERRRPAPAARDALPMAAVLVAVAVALDVMAGGPLRHFDQWIFSGGLPPRSGAWHLFWRTIVNAGQYWLAGSLTAVVAVVAVWRGRGVRLLVRAALWLAGTELVIRAAQTAFARTPPRTGRDLLFTEGYLSFPSGHAANAAACLTMIAALAGASRAWRAAAQALAAMVAVAVVALGYHWPTDALAGWGLGVSLGCAGRVLVTAGPRRDSAGPDGPRVRIPDHR